MFSGNTIFFELEGSQPHPDTNFINYWRWIEDYKIKDNIVLIQIFSPMFNHNNYIARRRNINFLKKKVSLNNFQYYPIEKLIDKFSKEDFKNFTPGLKDCLIDAITPVLDKFL